MKSKLQISDELALPLDVVTSTLVVYGGKGMGKTNFGSVLVEELSKAGLRWSTLDPLGVWWGLRHSSDGKGRGIECLILGGAHGDIPIEPTGGAVVADLVVDEPASVIIDFSRKPTGEMWTIGEKTRFVTDYAMRLFRRQGELVDGRRREPIFQILDEAARYIPQLIPAGNPDLARSVSAWETLVEEGRNIGIGVGLLTQRSARMNKSVSEVADAMFSFRIVGPNSIGAVTDWLGEHVPKDQIKKHVETLRSLDRGSCLVVSPGWLKFEDVVHIRARETFDSSATPKPGERPRRVTGEAAKPDLAKYVDRMRETIEKAKENDPRELREQIRRLKAQLVKTSTTSPAKTESDRSFEYEAKISKAVLRAIKERDATWSKTVRDHLRELERRIAEAAATVHYQARNFPFVPPAEISIEAPPTPHENPAPKVIPLRPAPEPRRLQSQSESNGHLSRSQIAILAALAQFEAIGRNVVPKKWIAALAGASHSSSTYANNLGALRTAGYIDYPEAGKLALTAEGREKAPEVEAPRSSEEMLQRCKEIVSRSQSAILDALARHYPKAVDKTDLASETEASATSSTFANNLGALRSAGMLDYPTPGQVRAADWIFLQGE
jgi:uncharacterized protein